MVNRLLLNTPNTMSAPQTEQPTVADILHAWDNDVSSSDIYHLILKWMEAHVGDPETTQEVQAWLRRAKEGEETNDLVEDFLFGPTYASIRSKHATSDQE